MLAAKTVTLSDAVEVLTAHHADPSVPVSEIHIQTVLLASSVGSDQHREGMKPYRELIVTARKTVPVPTLADGHISGA